MRRQAAKWPKTIARLALGLAETKGIGRATGVGNLDPTAEFAGSILDSGDTLSPRHLPQRHALEFSLRSFVNATLIAGSLLSDPPHHC